MKKIYFIGIVAIFFGSQLQPMDITDAASLTSVATDDLCIDNEDTLVQVDSVNIVYERSNLHQIVVHQESPPCSLREKRVAICLALTGTLGLGAFVVRMFYEVFSFRPDGGGS